MSTPRPSKLHPLMSGDLIWRHVTLSLKLTWRPGDPRGFRDHGHRIHSSGDYRNPPPPGEHAGLHRYAISLNRGRPKALREEVLRLRVLRAMLAKLNALGVDVGAIAVCAQHAHLVARLPIDPNATKLLVGSVKQRASHAVRDEIAGALWSRGGSYKPIRNQGHLLEALNYVAFRQERGALVWTLKHGFLMVVGPRPTRRLSEGELL